MVLVVLRQLRGKKLHRQKGLPYLPIFVSGGQYGLSTPNNISSDSPSAAAHIRHKTKRRTRSPLWCQDLTSGNVPFSSVVQERRFGEGVVFIFSNRSSVLYSLSAVMESSLSWHSLAIVFWESVIAVSFPMLWFKAVGLVLGNMVLNSGSSMESVKGTSGLIRDFG